MYRVSKRGLNEHSRKTRGVRRDENGFARCEVVQKSCMSIDFHHGRKHVGYLTHGSRTGQPRAERLHSIGTPRGMRTKKETAASFLHLAIFPIARPLFAHGKMPGHFVRCRFGRAPAVRKRCFPSQKDRDCTFYAGNAVFAPPRYEMPRQSIRTERGTDAKESVRRQRGGAYGPDCFSARPNRTSGIRSARTDDGWGRFARKRRLARMPCRLLSPYAQPRPE